MKLSTRLIAIISILIMNSIIIPNTTYAYNFRTTTNTKSLQKFNIAKNKTITEKELISLMKKASATIIKMCSPNTNSKEYALLDYRPLDKEFNNYEKIRKRLGIFSTKDYIDYIIKITSVKIVDGRLNIHQGDFGELPNYSTVKIKSKKQSNNRIVVKYFVTYPYAETILQEIVISLEGQNWKIQSWKGLI